MNVSELFDHFSKLKVLVIGDVMIDSYLWGRVDRISPEAPVPIVSVEKREKRLGGAANVALNLKALGAEPIICSVIGDDSEGKEFSNLLTEEGLTTEGIIFSDERPTTIKHRIIAKSQQLLRVDAESKSLLSQNENEDLFKRIDSLIGKVDLVILQDYDKGVLSSNNIPEIIKNANQRELPITVDPKKQSFLDYSGVTLFKPNLVELKGGLNIEINPQSEEELSLAVDQLQGLCPHEITLITLSEHGAFLRQKKNSLHEEAHKRNISDVSGAGDTVIAVASLCLAAGYSEEVLLKLANLAGGLVCEYVGVFPIDKERLQKEIQNLGI